MPGECVKLTTDVLVIGGGPAGLAAAIAAVHKGFKVTIADGARPPVDKVCGEGLMPDTLATLHELGIELSSQDGRPFAGMRFVDAHSSVEASFPFVGGLGVRRTVLHQKMVERAQDCGVTLLWNSPVSALSKSGATVGSEEIRARWIVGADGIHSRVRRWSGLCQSAPRKVRFAQRRHYRVAPWTDHVEIHWGHEIQAYVTPLRQNETCVVLISRDPGMRLDQALVEFPRLASRLSSAELSSADRGAVTAMCKLDRIYSGNIALTGDASGTVDAITGEGLCLSFLQARALANALAAGDLERYQRVHRRLAWRPNAMARLLLLLDRFPEVRKRALRALANEPALFGGLLAIHIGETSAMHSMATSVRVGWQFLAA
jgi:flavin-dependent dehydrogenase